MAAKNDKEKNRRSLNPFRGIIHGRLLTLDFFARHWLSVLAIIIMLIVYISNKYQCQTKMESIMKLNEEVEIMKTESIREKGIYMSLTRESELKHRSDSMNLKLEPSTQPPCIIK